MIKKEIVEYLEKNIDNYPLSSIVMRIYEAGYDYSSFIESYKYFLKQKKEKENIKVKKQKNTTKNKSKKLKNNLNKKIKNDRNNNSIKCPNCNNKVKRNYNLCPYCGNKLKNIKKNKKNIEKDLQKLKNIGKMSKN